MRLKDIMSTKVEAIRPDETLTRAKTLMKVKGIHHLVVMDHHQIVGMLTADTLQLRDAEGVTSVGDAMARHVIAATPETTIRQAANLMRGRAESALPILAGEKLAGIVTVSDLLDVLGRGVDRSTPKPRATLARRGLRPAAPHAHSRRDS